MKSSILLIAIFFTSFSTYAQFTVDVNRIYFERATTQYNKNNLERAEVYFNKALKFDSVIPTSDIARIGTLLNNDLQNYEIARSYAMRYFQIRKYNRSKEYKTMKTLLIKLKKTCKELAAQEKSESLKAIAFKKEQRESDSLHKLWTSISQKFYVTADSVGAFNKFNVATYKLNGNLGLIDGTGKILLKAEAFTNAIEHDGFIIFMDDVEKPKMLYCYNSQKAEGYQLPNITDFNTDAKNFGKVMMPRENGMLVTYPKGIADVIIYNLNKKEEVVMTNKEAVVKGFAKNGVIEGYNNKLEIKIDDQWFNIKTSVGAGVYPLFTSKDKLYGFFSSSDGRVFNQEYYNYLGGYCEGTFEMTEKGNTSWISADGIRKDSNQKSNDNYASTLRFTKIENKKYVIVGQQNGMEVMVMGTEKLLFLNDFISNRS